MVTEKQLRVLMIVAEKTHKDVARFLNVSEPRVTKIIKQPETAVRQSEKVKKWLLGFIGTNECQFVELDPLRINMIDDLAA